MRNTRRGFSGRRWLAWSLGILAALALSAWLAFTLSPWPSVLVIRHVFDQGAAEASAKLEKHVPAGLREWTDLRYDAQDPDALLDLSSPGYARALGIDAPALAPGRLAGALLYCGPHDARLASGEGPFGGFMRTVFWSYFGQKEVDGLPAARQFSVPLHVNAAFPPSFISVGNADPLKAHSVALAEALEAQGVPVTRLFYPEDHQPALAHEYQFDLDSADGQRALRESVAFLRALPTRAAD